jgi:hypothetical protein
MRDRRAQRAPTADHSSKGKRLPPDWIPTPGNYEQVALDAGLLCEDIEHELASFGDYWRARPGKDGTKLDWDATWRNWLRKARPGRARRGNAVSTQDIRAAEAAERTRTRQLELLEEHEQRKPR